MTRKPDIQYVGQFYVHGSEAKQLAAQNEKKKARTKLPLERLQNIQKIYVDPVALIGITVAVVMLVVMVIGAVQIGNAWEEYQAMSDYVHQVRRENADLHFTYRMGYNLQEIEAQALAMGLVPAAEVQRVDIAVTVTQPQPEPNVFQQAWDEFVWFLDGLFA